jgi:RNA polymerase sigma-70 factor (ECF subfamily)
LRGAVPGAEASVTFYMQHRDELLRYANRILRDRESAEDVVQEAWVCYADRLRKGGEIGQPLNYLYTIVRNLAVSVLRRSAVRSRMIAEIPDPDSVAHDVPSAERVLYYRDEFRLMAEAIAELPERTQIAFRMYKIEGCQLQEIAVRLDISVPRSHQLVKEAGLHVARRLLGDERRD